MDFEKALDELDKPDGNHSNAIQIILSNIGNGPLCGKKKQALRSRLGPFVDLSELPRAKELAAPDRKIEIDMYYLLERIEGALDPQASNGFRGALDELNKPNGNHSDAIQILKSNIDNKSLREIYSCARLEVRKIFRLHHPDLFANLSDKEKLNLANKLAEPDHEEGMYFLLKRIKASDVFMALDQLTVPGDEHNVAIDVLASTEYCYLLRSIFPCLSEEVQNIMLPYNSVILCLADLLDYNLNKPNSKQSRSSRRFP